MGNYCNVGNEMEIVLRVHVIIVRWCSYDWVLLM